MIEPAPGRAKTCPRCDAPFRCGPDTGSDGCWCNALPAMTPSPDIADCLCPACLSEATRTAPSAARRPLVEGEDYYLEGANVVFTALYHRRRGFCCQNGCRHCPYGAAGRGGGA